MAIRAATKSGRSCTNKHEHEEEEGVVVSVEDVDDDRLYLAGDLQMLTPTL